MGLITLAKGLVGRVPPAVNVDGSQAALRTSRYGDMYVSSMTGKSYAVSDEGNYFVATNPTVSTAVAYAVQASYDATKGYFFLKNDDSPGGKRIYMDFLRLIATTAPASATDAHAAMNLDAGNRYSSGGSSITPVNANMDTRTGTVAICRAGALTFAAATAAARLVHRSCFRSVILVVNDEIVFNFGSVEAGGSAGHAGTTAARLVVPAAPVVVGPQQSLMVSLFFTSNAVTAAQFEFEAGWWER